MDEQLQGVVSFCIEGMNRQEIRERILALEDQLKEAPQGEFPLKHHFAPGCYGREILIPAGSLLIGKIHKHAHLNIVSRGRVEVLTEWGVELIDAPRTFVSRPGTKRVVYAHEDTVWTTIHPTYETALERIEEQVIAKDYAEFEGLPGAAPSNQALPDAAVCNAAPHPASGHALQTAALRLLLRRRLPGAAPSVEVECLG